MKDKSRLREIGLWSGSFPACDQNGDDQICQDEFREIASGRDLAFGSHTFATVIFGAGAAAD